MRRKSKIRKYIIRVVCDLLRSQCGRSTARSNSLVGNAIEAHQTADMNITRGADRGEDIGSCRTARLLSCGCSESACKRTCPKNPQPRRRDNVIPRCHDPGNYYARVCRYLEGDHKEEPKKNGNFQATDRRRRVLVPSGL